MKVLTIQEQIKLHGAAMQFPSFPSNPIPFINVLYDGIKLYGNEWIESNEAKRLLFPLIGMSYGQMFNINSVDEFMKLTKGQ